MANNRCPSCYQVWEDHAIRAGGMLPVCLSPGVPTQGELFENIEAAIRLAAKLGDDAFDFIEGRGLAQDRREIFDALTRVYCALDGVRDELPSDSEAPQ